MSNLDPSAASSVPAQGADHSTATATVYRPHSRYLLYLLITITAGAFLAWMLLRSFDGVIAFMFALCSACAVWSAWNLFSRLTLDGKGLHLRTPLGGGSYVEYRQFAEVAAGGRFLPTVVVIYYPLRGDGLVDLDELRSLNLPAVEARDELLATLQQRTPH